LSGPSGTTNVTCSDGTLDLDLSGLPDGSYTLTVVATDGAGLQSPATVLRFTIDRSSPGSTPPIPGQPASGRGDTGKPSPAHTIVHEAPRLLPPLASGRVLGRPLARIARQASFGWLRWRNILRAVGALTRNGGLPILLFALVLLFIAVQDRIDRNDPKLVLAPLHAHQNLAFRPVGGTA
jgi:hypothetical protein